MKVFTAPYQGFDQPSSEDFSNPTFFQTSFADPQQYSDMDDTDIGQSGDDGGSGDIDPSNGQSTDFESFGGVNENGDAGVTGFPQNGPISWQQGSQHDGGQFDTANGAGQNEIPPTWTGDFDLPGFPTNNTQQHHHGDVTSAALDLGQFLANPYQRRSDTIGPNHSIAGLGIIEAYLTPPGWQPHQLPMDANAARELFNHQRTAARNLLEQGLAQDRQFPPYEQAQRAEMRNRGWELQRRLDQLVLNERVKIFFDWQNARDQSLATGFVVPDGQGRIEVDVRGCVTEAQRFFEFYNSIAPAWLSFSPPNPPTNASYGQTTAAAMIPQGNPAPGFSVDPHLMAGSSHMHGGAQNMGMAFPGQSLMSGFPGQMQLNSPNATFPGQFSHGHPSAGFNRQSFSNVPTAGFSQSPTAGYPNTGLNGQLGPNGVEGPYPAHAPAQGPMTPMSHGVPAMQSNHTGQGMARAGATGNRSSGQMTAQQKKEEVIKLLTDVGYKTNAAGEPDINPVTGLPDRVNPLNAGWGKTNKKLASNRTASTGSVLAETAQLHPDGNSTIGEKRGRGGKTKSPKKDNGNSNDNSMWLKNMVEQMGPPPSANIRPDAWKAGEDWAKRKAAERAGLPELTPKKKRRGKDLPSATEGLRITSDVAQKLMASGAPKLGGKTRATLSATAPSAPRPNVFAPPPTATGPLAQMPQQATDAATAMTNSGAPSSTVMSQGRDPPAAPLQNPFKMAIAQVLKADNDKVHAAGQRGQDETEDEEDEEDEDMDDDEEEGDGEGRSSSTENNDDPGDPSYGSRSNGRAAKRTKF